MVDFCTGDKEHVIFLYRAPLFDKCLEDLRSKGGFATEAARKVDQFIDIVLQPDGQKDREKFRFTRNSEARIKYCKKVDLGCGYRLVCIKKDGHLALLYVGTHDDCFRWIERRRTAEYDLGGIAPEAWIDVSSHRRTKCDEVGQEPEDDRLSRQYEEEFMRRVDDALLRKVFAGLVCARP